MKKKLIASTEYPSYLEDLLKEVDPRTDATKLISAIIEKCGYNQAPTSRYEKKSTFASIANALMALKGKKYAIKHATLIDNASGNYYRRGAKANVEDLATTFVDLNPKQKEVRCSRSQLFAHTLFLSHLSPNEQHAIPLDALYALYTGETKDPVSRYQFTALLKKAGYSTGAKRIDGRVVKCVLKTIFLPTQQIFSPFYSLLLFVTLLVTAMSKQQNLQREENEHVFTAIIAVVNTFSFSLSRAPPS